jgi:hypothetical protein
MDSWISHNNPGKQSALALGCTVVGAILMMGFRHFEWHMSDTTAGFLLGVMLLVIGIWAYAVRGRQTIVVDPRLRRISIEDVTQFGTKTRIIPFADITHVGIGYLGKASNYVKYYYLALKLENGENYALFGPGRFYEGSSDRSVVEGWKQRLEQYMNPHSP